MLNDEMQILQDVKKKRNPTVFTIQCQHQQQKSNVAKLLQPNQLCTSSQEHLWIKQ